MIIASDDAVFDAVDEEFAADGVGPGKPFPGEFGRIIHGEAFVHKPAVSVGIHDHIQQHFLFGVILAGETLHGQGNVPDIVFGGMRAADAVGLFASK